MTPTKRKAQNAARSLAGLAREAAIQAHGEAHEARIIARRKARDGADQRKKNRGLAAAVANLSMENET